jgi:4-coumarate--CoA ligase
MFSGANPSYTADELLHQLKITGARIVFVHPLFLESAQKACCLAGIPRESIVVIGTAPKGASFVSVDDLIADGSANVPNFTEKRLHPGEGKTKMAFLCLSSGTTGPPKVPDWFCLSTG